MRTSERDLTALRGGATGEELGAALRLAVGRLSRQLRRHAVGGLTPAQYSALATVDGRGPIRPSELADLEGVRPPTLSRIVVRLERREYFSRTGDPADGRSSLLAITPAGRAALEAVRLERTALLARSLAELAAPDRAAIAAAIPALERLVEEVHRRARDESAELALTARSN